MQRATVCVPASQMLLSPACGLTNAVHVVLKGAWQVHVDDVANAFDVQTSAGNVCGYQHPHSAAAEVPQGSLALVLHTAAHSTC